MTQIIDPMKFKDLVWPDVVFTKYQQQIIYSVMENDETVVPAGNMLGKDFVAAFCILWFFESRHPCKIITTSVKDMHLDVLWGEIAKFVRIAKHPLEASQGGNLVINTQEIRKVVNGELHKDSYIKRMVASEKSKQSFQGHHVTPDPGQPIDDLPRNLFVGDEASGLPEMYYDMTRPWAKRTLLFGNPWPCENFFKHAVLGKPGTKDSGGDIPSTDGSRFYRKVIKVTADDSDNVRFGKAMIKRHGEQILTRRGFLASTTIVPGILTFAEYLKRRKLWHPMEQCVSLDADWWEGAEEKLFPPDWMNRANEIARKGFSHLAAITTMGVDPAEGGDDTAWCVMNPYGILHLEAFKTQDTSKIVNTTLGLMQRFNVSPENVAFDRGGGGKQHADVMRSRGYPVTTVGFGESVTPELRRGMTPLERRRLENETKYVYLNRRAQMYSMLSERLNPENEVGFGIPAEYSELRRQLVPLPKQYDKEGRLFLPPKNKKSATSVEVTIRDLLGCSPDEADAAVLAAYRLEVRGRMFVRAGGIG